jgi:peptide deformylase
MAPTASTAFPLTLALVHYPDPVLRRRAAPVSDFGEDLRSFVERLYEAMDLNKGVGLAAPQVGVSRRIFVTDHVKRKDSAASERHVWINPRIAAPEGLEVYEEGCLSFPGVYAKVERPNRFQFHWQDEFGRAHERPFDIVAGDFLGVVVQHELDHLDGRIFVEHLTDAQLTLVRKRLRELEADYKKATGKVGAPLRR